MTYRERRLARADRLREWAEKRERKADAAHERVREIGDMIPFGQPVLVGHHSEGRHRRDLRRIEDGMRASVENARTAGSMRDRADGIEAQADRAIYDDDPDAAERLAERIADMEAERDRIKAFNASCRKGAPDESLLDERQRASLESSRRLTPYALGKGGAMPGYELTNLGGNIRRYKQRLAGLDRPKRARLIVARYDGVCRTCGDKVERGDTVRYHRAEREVECESCSSGDAD